ncbi:uncharacterized protein BDV14DRAFT_64017 [Aspergillus stella-maris]|uniref:uncharacterized protein n=1 Tax=Aspergillus stella-maris TaxID=1810926 RepID=UPI003CCD8398
MYQLSISIHGPGTVERAHWGFVIHQPPNIIGDLLHVLEIDRSTNWFEFETRDAHDITSQDAWSLAKIANINQSQRSAVAAVLENEAPPRGGTKRCQDWVVDALISLEVDELVKGGTSQDWARRIGMATSEIKRQVGVDWTSLNGRLND